MQRKNISLPFSSLSFSDDLLLANLTIALLNDFGCTANFRSEMGHATVTGTTVYMAPEVMGVEDEALNSKTSSNGSRESETDHRKRSGREAKDDPFAKVGASDKRPGVRPNPPFPLETSSSAPTRRDYSIINEYEDEINKENGNDSELSTVYVAERRRTNTDSPAQEASPLKDKKHGYGRKADIWSLGVTLSEMSTGRSPYRTAAAAIYNVCVSKKYPTFAETMSSDAHDFLSRCVPCFAFSVQCNKVQGSPIARTSFLTIIPPVIRCLVAEPRQRASCEDLLSHPFLLPQVFCC
jgi:serine/threonine protein kinase